MSHHVLLALCVGVAQTAVDPQTRLSRPSERADVRLVLQLTVDGLRHDLLTRGADRYGDDGLGHLLRTGTVYTDAHYQHANTETIVGHATLATGAQPAAHGLTGNVWYDTEQRALSYNIEDPDHLPLPVRAAEMTGDQVDPAQRLARTTGRSPAALLAETFGDKLLAYTGRRAKVFAVSGKDRSAVAMAGRGGTAYWFSADSGDFVTSSWYHDAYPAWVARWNAERQADRHAGTVWRLMDDVATYRLAHQDDRPYETDLRGYGRTFPHRFGAAGDKLLYTQLVASPIGDELLADFTADLLVAERLGTDDVPDFLSVSFSGLDAVDHFFGPASLESEEMMRRLDRTVARLLRFIDDQVGLDRTLLVLSADHGMAEMPEYMAELGLSTGRLHSDDVVTAADRFIAKEHDVTEAVRFYYRPFVYLNDQRLAAAGLDTAAVRESVAEALTRHPGVHLAITSQGLASRPDSPLLQRIRNNWHPTRSGDIYVVQEPYWFNFDKGPVAAMHGSPWRYDTHVPIVFVGPGITAQAIHRRVQPADVAPTLAAILGMSPPASAQGRVLPEVLASAER